MKAAKTKNAGRRTLPDAARAHCFKKGDDPRRWTHGQKSKKAVAITRDIQQWLAVVGEEICEVGKTYSECLARKLWERGVKGDMQAATIVLERLLGKVTQPVGGEGGGPIKLSFDFGSDNGGEYGKEKI